MPFQIRNFKRKRLCVKNSFQKRNRKPINWQINVKGKGSSRFSYRKISDETNAYQLSNIQSDVKKLDLSITLPTKSKITVTKDGETINDDTKVYTGTFTQSLELSENCTFEISIETYSDNSITIDGKEISLIKQIGKKVNRPS